MPGKHPGHWMISFRGPSIGRWSAAPISRSSRNIAPYGKVYHVGDRGDMIRLLKEEHGLAWTAHPRIKASSWTPDIFRHEDFFLADFWLGGAWKAMPADLSREKLGERVLNLLDDMANWGQRKYVPGEVDVFKIDHTHELYGHMNINYVQLDRVPRFDEGWQPVLDVLRSGKFFVTTGEILIPKFTVGGKGSGDVLKLAAERRNPNCAPTSNGPSRSPSPRSSPATANKSIASGSTSPTPPPSAAARSRITPAAQRPPLGPPRSLGHRRQRRLHAAGVD